MQKYFLHLYGVVWHACIGGESQGILIWREYIDLKREDDYIACKLEIQIFYSLIDQVDECITKMDIDKGKKQFFFYDMSFGLTAIVFPYGKKQIQILNPSYTPSTYSYEVNFDFNVIEEFERKQNGDQALALFQRDLHILILIVCDDESLLFLLMFGRVQLRYQDPGISSNAKFPKVEVTFGSLHRRQWDLGIILDYLIQVEFFVKKGLVIGVWI